MPTTNPVPSQDPSDLLFNAGKLDEVLNGTGTSFTDRLGTARRTVAGMNSDFDAQLADAESDLNVYRADAAASAAQALGYLNTIRTTSYGAYASDPATDPLGNPPTVGDEYFNTTSNLLKRFNGTTWQASDINTANLATPSGSSLVGYKQDAEYAVARTMLDLARQGVSPKDFGAVGNKVADDIDAMQKAIDWVIPRRDRFFLDLSGACYAISGALNVNLEAAPLDTAFAFLSIKHGAIHKTGPGYLFSASSGYNNQGLNVSGVAFSCTVGLAADVFDCDRLIDVLVEKCTFKRFRRVAYSGAVLRPGIGYYYTQSFKMTDCYIWGTDSYADYVIDFGATYDCKLTRVFISYGPGMVFRNAAHALSINCCIFQKITTAAIEFPAGGTNLQNVSIEDNYFEDNVKNISFSSTIVARALKISGNILTGSAAGKSIYLIDWNKIYFTSSNIISESNSATTIGFAVHGPITYETSFTIPIRSVNDYQNTDVGSGGVAWRDSPAIVYTSGNEARSYNAWSYRAKHTSGLAFQGNCLESSSGRSFVELNGKSVSGSTMQLRVGAFGNADIHQITGSGFPIYINNKVAFGATNDLYPVASGETKLGTASNRWSEVRGENIYAGISGVKWTAGPGSPEGVVSGLVGSLYSRTDGGAGTSLYVKETGTGNTGWVAK